MCELLLTVDVKEMMHATSLFLVGHKSDFLALKWIKLPVVSQGPEIIWIDTEGKFVEFLLWIEYRDEIIHLPFRVVMLCNGHVVLFCFKFVFPM